MFAEFLITDGTTTLDLLAANKRGNGFALTRYTPGRPTLKGGGIWQDSPLAQGRRLAHGTHGNINDAVELKITYPSHGEIIRVCQELDLLLEKATAYWTTDWQDEPVYIIARAPGESNSRYAVIHYASFGEYPDPYQEPYAGRGRRFVMDGIILGLERGAWLSQAPGTDVAIEVSNNFFSASTGFTYISNYRVDEGISSIRRSDNLATELIAASLPLTLFPSGATDDAVYFGSPKPFYSLVFDIATAMASTSHLIFWEYANSPSTWASTAYVEDNTTGFTVVGRNMVRIVPSAIGASWTARQLGGVGDTLYWLRARVASSTGVTALPTQQNNQIRTPSLPYIDVDSAQLTGDIDALIRLRMEIDAIYVSGLSYSQNIEKAFVGTRALARGQDFTAYINIDNDYNPNGVSVTFGSGAYSSYIQSPMGKLYAWDGTNNVYDTLATIEIDRSIAQQYYGEYRLFVRGLLMGGEEKIRAKVKYKGGTSYLQTEARPDSPSASGHQFLIDVGRIRIPPGEIRVNESSDTIQIIIEVNTFAATVADFILLPVDEWSAQLTGDTSSNNLTYYLDVDGTTYPKDRRRSLLRLASNGDIVDHYQVTTNQEPSLPAGVSSRLWFMLENAQGESFLSSGIKLYAVQRYHHLRSD